MTDTKVVTAEQIDADLFGPDYVFLRLPPLALDVSAAFAEAIAAFDAGECEAARKATWWFQNCALVEYHTSRTYLYLGRGRIAGYYSLASTHVEIPKAERDTLGLASERKNVPASLMTWIAKDRNAGISGEVLLVDALVRANEAAALQASAVFVLDAADEDTAKMWSERYGFRLLEKSKSRRMWMPLSAA
jgi:hypothetical protein